jgi:hypothetical protein
MKCPLCGKDASTVAHLTKHIAGGKKFGGHAIQQMEAQEIAERVFAGSYRQASVPNAVKVTVPEPEITEPHQRFLADLFSTLVSHKRLPKYQFERRVDAVVAMFLPDVFNQVYGWDVEFIVPEFPLKKASNNQSTNADSLWFRRAKGAITEAWIFFELKTDSASCNDEQLDIYRAAMDRGMPRLLGDLEAIANASASTSKYRAVQKRLEHLPADRPLELVYLSPTRIACADPRVRPLAFGDLAKINSRRYPEVWKLFQQIVLPSISD